MQDELIGFSQDVYAKDAKAVYYLITFLSSFAVSTTFATYVLFLLSQGLDLLQVNLVNLTFMTGNFLFEIPTGAYADYFGRKKSVLLSSLVQGIALGMYFFSSSIAMFILAETLGALAQTFASGALDAWLMNSLERKGYVGKVDFIFSHAGVVTQIGSLLGGLVGAYIGSQNLRFPMGVGALISFVTVGVTWLFMHEEKSLSKKTLSFAEGMLNMGNVAKEGILYGIRHKVILWLTFATILSLAAFQPLNMYWSPRLNTLAGNQIWLMGWVWAGIALFMMFGNLVIKKLLVLQKSYLWILVTTALLLSIPILFAALSNTFALVLSGFLVYEIGRGMLNPVTKSYLNKHIPDANRATVLSFNSMMGKIGAAIGLVALGWVGKNYSIQNAWLISGILLLFLIPIYIRVTEHEKSYR